MFCSFFFNDTATTEIYTLSLHDALPILLTLGKVHGEKLQKARSTRERFTNILLRQKANGPRHQKLTRLAALIRSEEHTSELQSHVNLVCRLLLEKKNKKKKNSKIYNTNT